MSFKPRYLQCSIKGHVISPEKETDLYEKLTRIEAKCKRCEAEIFVEIDPKNDEYYLVTEKTEILA